MRIPKGFLHQHFTFIPPIKLSRLYLSLRRAVDLIQDLFIFTWLVTSPRRGLDSGSLHLHFACHFATQWT